MLRSLVLQRPKAGRCVTQGYRNAINRQQRAAVHILNIPYNHLPYVEYVNGIPSKKNRKIQPWEYAAGYGRVWTSAESKDILPETTFLAMVPEHEVWIIYRNGGYNRAISNGTYLLIPFIDKIEAVRSPHTIVNGIFASCLSSEKKSLDVYAVIYYKWTDYEKSVVYRDVERGGCDAETSLQYVILEALANEAPKYAFKGDGTVDADVEKKLLECIRKKVAEYAPLYGMETVEIELRGAWDAAQEVPLKIYSLEPEANRPDVDVSILPNDYWTEVLEPPPFLRYTYGSEKMIHTPAVTSLEWAIPSPPDYHHFNMAPVVLMDPEEYKKKGGKVF